MKNRKAFTLLEIIIICLLLGIGLLSISKATSHARMTNHRITQSIIANQLATEGVETLYQFRNTNFLKHERQDQNSQIENYRSQTSGNLCRLATDYRLSGTCNNQLTSGHYYITNENGLNILKKGNDQDNIASATGAIDNKYAICLRDGVRTPCPEGHATGSDESRYGRFYRTIEGLGIYNMAENTTGGKLITNNFSGVNAQEYRFCSIVAWRGGQDGAIEICSTITNFIE